MMKFRKYSLALAESFDAWRIVPRAILVVYSALVLNLYLWFKSIPTFVQERCDASMLKILIDANVSLDQAKALACSIVDVVGGPTAAQSAFVTTITGLSAGIFGLYTATGRRWDGGLPTDVNAYHSEPGQPIVTTTKTLTPAQIQAAKAKKNEVPPSDDAPPSPRNQGEGDGESGDDNGPTI